MILYPRNSKLAGKDQVPAWEAVEEAQRLPASAWWLIAQPDHAALAGDLAANMASPLLPALNDKVVAAIALHDEGWRDFDCSAVVKDGRPLSFMEVPATDFLPAWRNSIKRAEESSPLGGILVSEHFCRLGKFGLTRQLSDSGTRLVADFLNDEQQRQQQLTAKQDLCREEVEILTDVLQFCDLLSLYLCCGSPRKIEFPQRFKGQAFQVRRQGELYLSSPPLFGPGMSLAVTARTFPGSNSVEIPLLIN